MPRPTIAFLPSHPAQLWLMRPVAESVRAFADPVWIVRDKDCLLDLARAMKLESDVISAAQRGLLKNATTLAADIVRAGRLQRRRRIDCWFTKYGAACIAARLTGPLPGERDRGVVLVQELRLLTPDRDVLRIRLDARTGAFLDVAGRGLAKARKKGNRL